MKIVDRPTQLICISNIYLLTDKYLSTNICQQTNTKDIAGQSARMKNDRDSIRNSCDVFLLNGLL